MKKFPKCKGTFWTSFIEKGSNSVLIENLRLNQNSRKAFFWRSLILLSVILIFYTRFVILKYLDSDENLHPTIVNVGRNLRSAEQTTTTTTTPIPTTTSIFIEKILQSTTINPSLENLDKDQSSNCTYPAILDFPSDGLTKEQRHHGWIAVHIFLAFYSFFFLAIICDDYFIPAIEQICSNFSMQKDVIGATFMAAATSSPELFMNCVGTFVTKGDIGVSMIVGSAVFNILVIPACCGFFVLGQYVKIDWWPVTRDCLMYGIAILALIGTLADGRVMWYEALFLVFGYFVYMAVMYYNDEVARTARNLISKYGRRTHYRPFREVTEFSPLLLHGTKNITHSKPSLASEAFADNDNSRRIGLPDIALSVNSLNSHESDHADDPWNLNGRNIFEYFCRWPITLILWLTIPDSRKHPNWKYVTFVLSITWIGLISYIVAYLITIIGDTFDIPDSIMGLTILAAGMSVPEAVTSIIVTKQGQGAMGISNSLGANTFDILLCLGLPWFIKAYFLPTNAGELWVTLNSTGFTYSAICLLATLFGLFIAFVVNRFILDWKMGVACSVMYVGFIIIASMIELNVFFPVNLPICKH